MIAIIAESCSHTGINNLPVRQVKQNTIVSISPDPTFYSEFPEVLNCIDILIINDTTLIIQNQPNEENKNHFVAYSTRSFECLGSFIPYGRASGEMLFPSFAKGNSRSNFGISESPLGKSYIVDLDNTISSGLATIKESIAMPVNASFWIPVSDDKQITTNISKDGYLFSLGYRNGDIIETFNPYRNINYSEQYITNYSGILVYNEEKNILVHIMLFLPQITIMNINDRTIQLIAVNDDYKQWKMAVNQTTDLEVFQYYSNATSSSKFIIASYVECKLGDLIQGENECCLHVFDWEGNLLKKIKIEENIGNMAFDERTGFLYCVDNMRGTVIRYNLSDII